MECTELIDSQKYINENDKNELRFEPTFEGASLILSNIIANIIEL